MTLQLDENRKHKLKFAKMYHKVLFFAKKMYIFQTLFNRGYKGN